MYFHEVFLFFFAIFNSMFPFEYITLFSATNYAETLQVDIPIDIITRKVLTNVSSDLFVRENSSFYYSLLVLPIIPIPTRSKVSLDPGR